MKKIKTATMTILLATTLSLTIYNVTGYVKKNRIENSLNGYLTKIIDEKSKNVDYEYYFFFVVSPMDCANCTQFLTSQNFMDYLKHFVDTINKKIFTSFIVYGNLTKEEKLDFVADIKDQTNIILENRSKIEIFLKNFLNASTTPLVIVLDKNKSLKYWRSFHVADTNYEGPYIKFLNSLGTIL